MVEEITKDVEHVLKWLAAEYYFLEQLHKDLEKIEREDISEQEKDLQKNIRVIHYIGNAERVVQRDLERIRRELQQGDGKISLVPLPELLQQLEVPAAQLLKNGSKYLGALRERVDRTRVLIAAERKQRNKAYQSKITQEIKNQKLEIEDLEKWLAMLDAVLRRIPTLKTGMTRRDFLKSALVMGAAAATMEFERKTKAFHRGSGLFDKHIFGSNEIYKLPVQGVFLTIDDGPFIQGKKRFDLEERKANLKTMLDYLTEHRYGAIFFWVGQRLEEALRDDEYRMILVDCVRSGFMIGNHSYTHRPFSVLSSQEILNEIDKTDTLIDWLYKNAGVQRSVKLLRFPYGDRPTFFERVEVYGGIKQRGYQIMFWSKDTNDWKKEATISSVIQQVSSVRNGDIVLIHEFPRTISQFLDPLCKDITGKGLTIEKYRGV